MTRAPIGPLEVSFDDDEVGLYLHDHATPQEKECLSTFLRVLELTEMECNVAIITQPGKGYPGGVVYLIATCGDVLELWLETNQSTRASCRGISRGSLARMDVTIWGGHDG
ncbi:MAG TPA: hypothetical protein VGM72_13790 [Micropepsaceae bacterium]|jgi:hypothetical protein